MVSCVWTLLSGDYFDKVNNDRSVSAYPATWCGWCGSWISRSEHPFPQAMTFPESDDDQFIYPRIWQCMTKQSFLVNPNPQMFFWDFFERVMPFCHYQLHFNYMYNILLYNNFNYNILLYNNFNYNILCIIRSLLISRTSQRAVEISKTFMSFRWGCFISWNFRITLDFYPFGSQGHQQPVRNAPWMASRIQSGRHNTHYKCIRRVQRLEANQDYGKFLQVVTGEELASVDPKAEISIHVGRLAEWLITNPWCPRWRWTEFPRLALLINQVCELNLLMLSRGKSSSQVCKVIISFDSQLTPWLRY
jgi:hypothetical protein